MHESIRSIPLDAILLYLRLIGYFLVGTLLFQFALLHTHSRFALAMVGIFFYALGLSVNLDTFLIPPAAISARSILLTPFIYLLAFLLIRSIWGRMKIKRSRIMHLTRE
jgi:hypothetical protein